MGVLMGVAFFTLIERKFIGLAHYRKGPNKAVVWGLRQPIADALKLLSKESLKFASFKIVIFFCGPALGLLLIILCWGWYEYSFNSQTSTIKMIVILAIIRINAYTFLLTRWGSNSKYALLGGHRAVAQIISYEVCLILIILVILYLRKTFNPQQLRVLQSNYWVLIASIPLRATWLLMCLAETNRTPFDLAEGESEIVSGFNIEYGGGLFAFIFIREYGIIILLGFIRCLFFMGYRAILIKLFLLCFIFVWVRCSFPRVRYDELIILSWKVALPFRLVIIGASCCLV